MPVTRNTSSTLSAVRMRMRSPTFAPRSPARSVPITASPGPMRQLPETMRSWIFTMRSKRTGSMPTSAIDLVALPRSAKPGPVTIGETAVTCGVRSSSGSTRSHWSMERRRCARGSTRAITAPVRGSTTRLGTSSGGRTTMCACVDSVRSARLACRLFTSAVMKMITATPTVVPATMSSDCMRPSRRKRIATIHSNGIAPIARAPRISRPRARAGRATRMRRSG